MKFGIYIRSIGERTEGLCIEACKKLIPKEDVHILRDYHPSYNVYKEMFVRAQKSNYDWFMGLDADVVLYPDALDMILDKISQVDAQKTFKFTFHTYDPVYRSKIDRGNHIYNNEHTQLASVELEKNIRISRMPRILKFFYDKGYYLKPETSIRGRILKDYGLQNFSYPEIIGVHGAEQYLWETFRSFAIRARRNPEWERKHGFLADPQRDDLDKLAAFLGWNHGKSHKIEDVDARLADEIKIIIESEGLTERGELTLGYDMFLKKYQNMA